MVLEQHPLHSNETGLDFPGVYIQPDFLSTEDEARVMLGIDEMPWDTSQSGRRKQVFIQKQPTSIFGLITSTVHPQNFGPKTNFKKMKLALGQFRGFPEFSEFVQKRLGDVPLLAGFQTIEQCSLEYDPTKGASIDPHIDDCWVWGERVVTVNCLSDSVLTLARYIGDVKRYNLPLVESYEKHLLGHLLTDEYLRQFDSMLIQLPMPNRSLMVLYGPARYQFEHCIFRKDIEQRRVCIAYREFTPMYLPGGRDHSHGVPVLDRAQLFWNHLDSVVESAP